MIIVDTREQLPLWTTNIERRKLDVGDYTTTILENLAHAERKSPGDLTGTLLGGHARFKREILRAQDKNIRLAVFVECTREAFVRGDYPGSQYTKARRDTVLKIAATIETKYGVRFVWCSDRDHMRGVLLAWFEALELRLEDNN